jgi:hypothetical protein
MNHSSQKPSIHGGLSRVTGRGNRSWFHGLVRLGPVAPYFVQKFVTTYSTEAFLTNAKKSASISPLYINPSILSQFCGRKKKSDPRHRVEHETDRIEQRLIEAQVQHESNEKVDN